MQDLCKGDLAPGFCRALGWPPDVGRMAATNQTFRSSLVRNATSCKLHLITGIAGDRRVAVALTSLCRCLTLCILSRDLKERNMYDLNQGLAYR